MQNKSFVYSLASDYHIYRYITLLVVCIIPRSVSGRWTSTWQYSLIEEEQPGKVVAVDFTQDGNMSVA